MNKRRSHTYMKCAKYWNKDTTPTMTKHLSHSRECQYVLWKINGIQQPIRNAVLLSAIVLLSIISTVVIEKVQAITSSSSVISSGNHNNNKMTNDNSNLTGGLGLIA